jgi:small subunit ribosomal protein S16
MAVKLRLKRLGRVHRSVYRLSAMEGRNPRDGRVLEELGLYDPANRSASEQVKLNRERIEFWLERGAVPSDTVRRLLRNGGIKVK